jgi:hypothetical protein
MAFQFGIMNEPHDVDVSQWVISAQAAVNAIREAGATTQTILIPGKCYWRCMRLNKLTPEMRFLLV